RSPGGFTWRALWFLRIFACSSLSSFTQSKGMKCHVPEISWHNRDPIFSVDFQPSSDKCRRLASCGSDTHVMVWFVMLHSNGDISLEFRSDLNRHTKTVNVVRFSNNGEILASGDDEANIILWKQQEKQSGDLFDESIENKEHWVVQKVLRGHLEDICDLSWSPNDTFLASGSVDNAAIVWDVPKGKNVSVLKENKGFVQGVAWDPLNVYFATLSSDRSLRVFSTRTKKALHRVQKAVIPQAKLKEEGKASRLFYDDTLKSFCRRLAFSPDGELLVTPCGIIEHDEGKATNTVYVFARTKLSEPAYYLPIGEKPSLAVRFCPIFFKLRGTEKVESSESVAAEKVDSRNHSHCRLPYRMVFAVATQNAILLYDTEQSSPFAHITNIHYTRLSDLTWSPDGLVLVASSTDGFCSLITFSEGEIGETYDGELPFKSVVDEASHSPSGSKKGGTQQKKQASTAIQNGTTDAEEKLAEEPNASLATSEAPVEDMEVDIVVEEKRDEDGVADGNCSKGSENQPSESRECQPIQRDECLESKSSSEMRETVSTETKAASLETKATSMEMVSLVGKLENKESETAQKAPRRVQLITLCSKKL
ncbi:unnamed protein product, partial [Ixodes hexagonus]